MYVWNLYFRLCLCSCWHAWLHRMLTQMLEMRQLTGEWVLTENFLMCQDTGTSYFLQFYPKLHAFGISLVPFAFLPNDSVSKKHLPSQKSKSNYKIHILFSFIQYIIALGNILLQIQNKTLHSGKKNGWSGENMEENCVSLSFLYSYFYSCP